MPVTLTPFHVPVPPGVPGLTPNSMGFLPYPNDDGFPEGTTAWTDGTMRGPNGAILRDNGAAGNVVVRLPGGGTNKDVARLPNGNPLPSVIAGTAYTVDSPTPGELPSTDPLFVAGVMQPEPVYDSAVHGGWGTIIQVNGPPSSWARRDDRWIWPDGRITDAQQTVLGFTNDRAAAARELAARGATPSITWTRSPVIAVPPGSNNDQTGSGGGFVVTSQQQTGDSYTFQREETDAGFGTRPIITGDPNPHLDPIREDEQIPGALDTPGNAGGGGGGVVAKPSPSGVTLGTGGTAPGGAPANFLTSTTLGIPNWAWIAAALVLALRKGRK